MTQERPALARSASRRLEDIADWIGGGAGPAWAALGALGALVAASRARDIATFRRWLAKDDIAAILAGLFDGPPDRPRRIPWSIDPFIDPSGLLQPLNLLKPDRDRLASGWLSAIQYAETWHPRAVATLEVDGDRLTLGDLELLLETLAPREAPIAAVVADSRLGSGGDFRWPIRIALTGATPKQDIGARLTAYFERNHHWVTGMVEFVTPSGPHEAVDILIASGSLDQTINRLDTVRHGIDAHTLLVLGGLGDASGMTTVDLRGALESSVDPWALAVVDVPDHRIEAWFTDLIRELSHDLTLEHGLRVMAIRNETGLPFIVAEPRALATMSARAAAERAIDALPRAEPGGLIVLPNIIPAAFLGGRWLREQLLQAIGEPDAFLEERRWASATSTLNRWMDKVHERFAAGHRSFAEPPDDQANIGVEPEAMPVRPRFLQAAVARPGDPNADAIVEPLEPSTPYVLNVRVGEPAAGWAQGDTPAPLAALERDGRRHRLRVVLDPLDGKTQPQERRIDLPPTGDSSTCHFEVLSSTSGTLRGRLILAFRDRVLQTALVTAATKGAEIEIETVVRPGLAGLSTRRAFDIALVHNHVPGGGTHVTALAGRWTTARAVDLDQSIEAIRGFLTDAAKRARRHSGLGSQPTIELLVDLARHGFSLRKLIIPEDDPDGLGDPGRTRRVQVVSAEAEAFFPVEIFYDFVPPRPDGATLCRNAVNALGTGRCDPATYHGVPARNGTIDVVCPAGFWSMNRVIERYASPKQVIPNLEGHDFGVRSEPVGSRDVLGGLSDALFARSNLVTSKDAQAVVTALSKLPNGTPQTAATWDKWLELIEASGPGLLVLLSHTDVIRARRDSALVIAASDRCYATTFGRSFVREAVRPDASPDDRPGPVVFLLGCDTTHTWSQYQSFVTLFRENHAALVIGTVGSVAARHAPSVAVKLIEHLAARAVPGAAAPAETIGDILLTARQQLLINGEIMALALSSYGDADWRLS